MRSYAFQDAYSQILSGRPIDDNLGGPSTKVRCQAAIHELAMAL